MSLDSFCIAPPSCTPTWIVSRELDHPNVVRFLGACVRPPRMCFVMELCRQSLFKLLHDSKTPLSEDTLIRYAVCACRHPVSLRLRAGACSYFPMDARNGCGGGGGI